MPNMAFIWLRQQDEAKGAVSCIHSSLRSATGKGISAASQEKLLPLLPIHM